MVNDTTRLLGLDGLVVVAVEDVTDRQGSVVHLATGDEQAAVPAVRYAGQPSQAVGEHQAAAAASTPA